MSCGKPIEIICTGNSKGNEWFIRNVSLETSNVIRRCTLNKTKQVNGYIQHHDALKNVTINESFRKRLVPGIEREDEQVSVRIFQKNN